MEVLPRSPAAARTTTVEVTLNPDTVLPRSMIRTDSINNQGVTIRPR